MKVLETLACKLNPFQQEGPVGPPASESVSAVTCQAKTTAYEKAQTAALEALAKSVGANPSDITKNRVARPSNAALKNLTVTLTNKEA